MATGLTPIRRVVTGEDERGRSTIVWDGAAPNAHPAPEPGRGHTDLWVWNETPPRLRDDVDAGNLPYEFPCPPDGGHLRVVQGAPRPPSYDASRDSSAIAPHAPKPRTPGARVWDRGGNNLYSSAMHKTQTIDYGILLAGERELILDDCTVVMTPGDIVVQVGAWHQWSNPKGSLMAFDMFAARFVDGAAGLAQGNDAPLHAAPKLPHGVKAARRIVTIDREEGRGALVSDGPAPDVKFDPARPGFAAATLWVTDAHPAHIVYESLHLGHSLEPARGGSICRVYTYPPDDEWKGRASRAEAEAYFRAMGSPGACAYAPDAPHPYMQKTKTLEFAFVLEGEIVLVLDTAQVRLGAGNLVIQRGTRHAWSNRSTQPARLAICTHDAREG